MLRHLSTNADDVTLEMVDDPWRNGYPALD